MNNFEQMSEVIILCWCTICSMIVIVHTSLPLDAQNKLLGIRAGDNGTALINSNDSTLGTTEFTKTRDFVKCPEKGEKNIFFLETSCFVSSAKFEPFGKQLVLSQISLCAIESAAAANPNSSIYLLYTCPLDVATITRADALTATIFDYPNVYIWLEELTSVFRGSPVETLLASGKIQTSRWPLHDSSDVLRLLVLWKFGGVYLDLDFIVTKHLERSVPTNFVGLNCAKDEVNNAALGFLAEGVGHDFVGSCLVELAKTFNGQQAYAFNGPVLLQRMLDRRCGVNSCGEVGPAPDGHIVRQCGGIAILARSAFYPLCFTETRRYYEVGACADALPEMRAAVALHLYHTSSGVHEWASLRKGSGQPIDCFQRDFCPRVYNRTPESWPEHVEP